MTQVAETQNLNREKRIMMPPDQQHPTAGSTSSTAKYTSNLFKFTVNGKTYDVKKEQEKMDKVNKVALGKKFKDRKDKDIDNDGDVDASDKYLHKRRQTVSKAIKNERMEKGIDKLPRQFLNPDKEVMILKKGKVIVIDKKDQDRYLSLIHI